MANTKEKKEETKTEEKPKEEIKETVDVPAENKEVKIGSMDQLFRFRTNGPVVEVRAPNLKKAVKKYKAIREEAKRRIANAKAKQ